jgi:hypothetical protein
MRLGGSIRLKSFWTIIRCENKDRVFCNTKVIDRIEQLDHYPL